MVPSREVAFRRNQPVILPRVPIYLVRIPQLSQAGETGIGDIGMTNLGVRQLLSFAFNTPGLPSNPLAIRLIATSSETPHGAQF